MCRCSENSIGQFINSMTMNIDTYISIFLSNISALSVESRHNSKLKRFALDADRRQRLIETESKEYYKMVQFVAAFVVSENKSVTSIANIWAELSEKSRKIMMLAFDIHVLSTVSSDNTDDDHNNNDNGDEEKDDGEMNCEDDDCDEELADSLWDDMEDALKRENQDSPGERVKAEEQKKKKKKLSRLSTSDIAKWKEARKKAKRILLEKAFPFATILNPLLRCPIRRNLDTLHDKIIQSIGNVDFSQLKEIDVDTMSCIEYLIDTKKCEKFPAGNLCFFTSDHSVVEGMKCLWNYWNDPNVTWKSVSSF